MGFFYANVHITVSWENSSPLSDPTGVGYTLLDYHVFEQRYNNY